MKEKLEAVNIIIDAVPRLGVQEVTRLGMREADMREVAKFMRRAVLDEESPERVRRDVTNFVGNFQEVKFTFTSGERAYEFFERNKLAKV